MRAAENWHVGLGVCMRKGDRMGLGIRELSLVVLADNSYRVSSSILMRKQLRAKAMRRHNYTVTAGNTECIDTQYVHDYLFGGVLFFPSAGIEHLHPIGQ